MVANFVPNDVKVFFVPDRRNANVEIDQHSGFQLLGNAMADGIQTRSLRREVRALCPATQVLFPCEANQRA